MSSRTIKQEVSRSIEALREETGTGDKLLVEAAEARSNRDEWNRYLAVPEAAPHQDIKSMHERAVQSEAGEHDAGTLHESRDHASFRVLAQECEMLRESRDNLQKKLDLALAELEDEKRLNRELSQDMSERIREVFVMLPDAKERAVMDLYKEAKKLELTRKCSHEASANFERMRAQLARRVSTLQSAVAAETVRNKELLAAMKRGLTVQEETLRTLLREWEVARTELEQRAASAETGAEEERRRMYAVVEEMVRKGIAEGEQKLRRELAERSGESAARLAAMAENEAGLRVELASLEGQMRERERHFREREAGLKEEVEAVHREWQLRFDAAALELHARHDHLASLLQAKEEEAAVLLERSRVEEGRSAERAAVRAEQEQRAALQQAEEREKQLYKRLVEAEQRMRDAQGQVGAAVALLEAQAAAAESSSEAALAAALATSRDTRAEHRFHLATIATLGDKCRTLVLAKQALEHENRRLLLDLGMQAGREWLQTEHARAFLAHQHPPPPAPDGSRWAADAAPLAHLAHLSPAPTDPPPAHLPNGTASPPSRPSPPHPLADAPFHPPPDPSLLAGLSVLSPPLPLRAPAPPAAAPPRWRWEDAADLCAPSPSHSPPPPHRSPQQPEPLPASSSASAAGKAAGDARRNERASAQLASSSGRRGGEGDGGATRGGGWAVEAAGAVRGGGEVIRVDEEVAGPAALARLGGAAQLAPPGASAGGMHGRREAATPHVLFPVQEAGDDSLTQLM